MDTGAQTTVIGYKQARAYCRFMGVKFKLKRSDKRYLFGDDKQNSMGKITIRIPLVDDKVIQIEVDVVQANVPLLIGLDILDKYQMYVNTVTNNLVAPFLEISTPLVRKLGHVYLAWAERDKILFTKQELLKLHRAFSHPTADKLLNLLKLARPWETDAETKKILEDIAKNCDTCQRFSAPPVRFKVTLPTEESLVFGDELSLDLMWIDGKAVLHIVDTATRFSAATFLDSNGSTYGQSVEGVWMAFTHTWCTMYTGYPNRMRTDQGSIFTSERWKQLTDIAGVQLRLSGVRAHNSLGIGERLHSPLRRIFEKVKHNYPAADPKYLLSIAVKAMNDTIGENGLVPSRLVFGIIPRFPILNSDLPNQKERLAIIQMAQAEMNSIVAERRVLAALTRDIPPAADRTYKIGEDVLVYSEKDKKWLGPFIVVDATGRLITVQSQDRSTRQQFNATQVKPFYREFENLAFFLSNSDDSPPFEIHITEVINPGDPRYENFEEAIKKEIDGLIKNGTWKVVCYDETPKDACVLSGRFVLAIKDEGTDKEIYKARFVVRGHRDKLKKYLVHDISVIKQQGIKMLIGIASIFGLRLFSSDVIQSYIQSLENLQRKVLIKPTKEFNLKPNELLELLKPLYGLAESGDYWGRSFRYHLIEELGMQTGVSDASLFYKKLGERLVGLCGNYVDDTLHAGTKEYSDLCKKTEKKFKCKERDWDNLQFAGVEIETKESGFEVHQKRYIQKITELSHDATYADFRSLRAKLAWTNNSRPDISCSVALLTQVTEDVFNTDRSTYVKKINAIVKHLKTNPDVTLKYPKLDKESLQLTVYSDASFATNKDLSSQLGYFIFISDKNNLCQPIYWTSYKAKRVNRSVLGSETMAFADAFDMALVIKHDLQNIMGKVVPLSMFTDSLSLFDVLTRAKVTTERRLMIDLQTVKESYDKKEINHVSFIRSEYNIADALTKVKKDSILLQTLKSGRLDHPVEQWIIRTETELAKNEDAQVIKKREC